MVRPDELAERRIRMRAAIEGEDLVAHRSADGSVQLYCESDFKFWRAGGLEHGAGLAKLARRIWNAVVEFLTFYGLKDSRETEPGPVVELPIGALVRLFEIPSEWQTRFHLPPVEDALFSDVSKSEHIRDRALFFGNGAVIAWQQLPEGQRLRMVWHSWIDSLEPEPEPSHVPA
jgi:hypothetical protein